jgi:enoyl-CoA hydratase/carnithine racemase
MRLGSIDGIDVTVREHLLTIRIVRPERRNALTPNQVNHIAKLCLDAEDDNDVRVVVLTGTGDAFCAGADLGDVDLSAGGGQIPPISMGRNVFIPLLELSKPLIGVINGVAGGGGLGLALCCDIRLASDKARFNTAFTRIGLANNDAVAWLLPRTVGLAKALELMYIPRNFDAAEAERIGLVSYVRPHDELADFAAEFVGQVLAAPPIGVRLTKRLAIEGMDRSYREHVLAQEYATLANRTMANHDVQEGIAAFKEKRKPEFEGLLMKPRWDNY